MDKLDNVEDVYTHAWDIPNIQKLTRTDHERPGDDKQPIIKTIDNWNNKYLINPTKTIAFIGDSYCAHLNADDPRSTGWASWPEIVAKHFNAEILQIGFGGLPFVSSFFNAHIKHPGCGDESILERADIIIACVSAPDRLPTRTGYSISPSSMYSKVNSRLNTFFDPRKALNRQSIDIYSKKIFKAGKAYYDYLFLGNFHYIAQKGAIRELDDLIRANQTIIWLPCFKESMCDYKPKNGVIGDLELFEIFKNENPLHPDVTLETKVDYKFRGGPTMANHMCRKSNQKLARYLIDYIANKKQYRIAGKNQIPITEILREYPYEEN